MGDLLIKQKHTRMQQWQSTEMLARKPWPPVYYSSRTNSHPRQSFNFRPADAFPWRDANHYSHQHYSVASPPSQKFKDHYYLAPYYRNAMPPPPNPNRLLMVDPSKRRVQLRYSNSMSPCHCKSRSVEDVSADVLEVKGGWEEDVNRNKVLRAHRNDDGAIRYNGRSMENLLTDPSYPSPKRAGSFQV